MFQGLLRRTIMNYPPILPQDISFESGNVKLIVSAIGFPFLKFLMIVLEIYLENPGRQSKIRKLFSSVFFTTDIYPRLVEG